MNDCTRGAQGRVGRTITFNCTVFYAYFRALSALRDTSLFLFVFFKLFVQRRLRIKLARIFLSKVVSCASLRLPKSLRWHSFVSNRDALSRVVRRNRCPALSGKASPSTRTYPSTLSDAEEYVPILSRDRDTRERRLERLGAQIFHSKSFTQRWHHGRYKTSSTTARYGAHWITYLHPRRFRTSSSTRLDRTSLIAHNKHTKRGTFPLTIPTTTTSKPRRYCRRCDACGSSSSYPHLGIS